jgi:hypothetical protein
MLYVLQYQETLRSVSMFSVFPTLRNEHLLFPYNQKIYCEHIHEIYLIDSGTHVVCISWIYANT